MPRASLSLARLVLTLLAVSLLPACASSGPSGPDLDARLLGVWADEGGARVTISPGDGGYAVGVVDSDGEVFDVVSVTWDGATLVWVYDVPSTGYRVRHETTAITQGRLDVRWENEFDSGTDTLTRVE